MPEDVGTTPQGAVAPPEATAKAEQVAGATTPPQPTVPDMGEVERLRKEREELQRQLEFEKKSRADENRFITRMAQSQQKVEMAAARAKQDILAQAADGTLDTSGLSVKARLDQVEAEAEKARQKLRGEASTYQATNEMFNALRQAGYDPMAQNLPPQVLEIQREYNEVIREGGSLEGVVAKAKALATPKPQDLDALKKQIADDIRKELLAEETKKKSLKVDTGVPTAQSISNLSAEEKIRLGCKTKYDK